MAASQYQFGSVAEAITRYDPPLLTGVYPEMIRMDAYDIEDVDLQLSGGRIGPESEPAILVTIRGTDWDTGQPATVRVVVDRDEFEGGLLRGCEVLDHSRARREI